MSGGSNFQPLIKGTDGFDGGSFGEWASPMARRYKVIKIKKRGFLSGPLEAEKLEEILNDQAAQGWLFDRALMSETLVLEKDTFLLVFHRED